MTDLLDWKTENAEESLTMLFARLHASANNQIEWYTRKRRGKRILAVLSRNGALILLGIAAMLPLIATLVPATESQSPFAPIWVSIVVALAAGFVAYDRAQGFSTGWIRFVQTELQLRDALELFELDWEAQRATWRGGPPTDVQLDAMLRLARSFAMQINTTVMAETNAWVEEFQAAMRNMDESIKARIAEDTKRREARALGAANITVTNGDQCTEGWTLAAGDRPQLRYTSRTAAVIDLPAGLTVFKVRGMINGKEKQAECAAFVTAGATARVDLTLD